MIIFRLGVVILQGYHIFHTFKYNAKWDDYVNSNITKIIKTFCIKIPLTYFNVYNLYNVYNVRYTRKIYFTRNNLHSSWKRGNKALF